MFSEFGEIISAFILKNESADPLSNSGFVCFKNAESALNAIEKLNRSKREDGSLILVSPHIAKRENELTSEKSKQMINLNMTKNFNSNLFVKYVPTEVTEEELEKVFSPYGKILSIKLKKKYAPF
jgi:polyadenylate-binding protein